MALLNAPHALVPSSVGSRSADVSFAWQPLSKIPLSGLNGRDASSSGPNERNLALDSLPKASNRWIPTSVDAMPERVVR